MFKKNLTQKNKGIYFPRNTFEIPEYIHQLKIDERKTGGVEAKLLLNALLNFIVLEGEEISQSPNFVLDILNEFDISEQNQLDLIFAGLEHKYGAEIFIRNYWIFRQSENQSDALAILCSIFTFYDYNFKYPVYYDNGKSLYKYPVYSKREVIKVPEGIEKIYENAFINCENIRMIILPSTIKYINGLAFSGCPNIESVYVSTKNKHYFDLDGVLMVNNEKSYSILYYPSAKMDEEYILPFGINSISSFAFMNSKFRKIKIENKTIEIEKFGFVSCTNLESIITDSNEIECKEDAFIECNLLKNAPQNILKCSKSIEKCSVAFELDENGKITISDSEISSIKNENEITDETIINNISNKQTMSADKTPSEIKKIFDDYIIGHEEAKKTLAVAVYTHFMRSRNTQAQIGKSNILLCGPTGCGKTEFARTIAKCLDVPFITADATMITETGWRGYDPTDLLRDLYYKSNCDIELTQKGIVYIDEIDKLAVFGENSHRETFSKGTQQGLLKIIEGGDIRVPLNKEFGQEIIINTDNILFIVGGAFDGIIKKKLEEHKQIGFSAIENNIKNKKDYIKLEAKDFVKYGMTQEFIGRFPILIQLDELTEDDIFKILTEPKNSIIEQYTKIINLTGAEVEFEEDILREVAAQAVKKGTGARGVRSIMENIVQNIIYELPDNKNIKKVIINKNILSDSKAPEYVLNE